MTQDTSCFPGALNWEKLSHEAKLRLGIPASLPWGMAKSGVVHNCKFRRKKKAFDLQKNHIYLHTHMPSPLWYCNFYLIQKGIRQEDET